MCMRGGWSVCMQFNITCNVEEFATQEANFTVRKQNDLGFVCSPTGEY